jgi:peptide/nickel transport system permease protein
VPRLRFFAARAAKALAVLLGVIVLSFFLVHAAPGDPALMLAGESGAVDEKFLQDVRHQFGLDRSLPAQLVIYVRQMAMLDLGTSYREGRPVASMIVERLPATLLLAVTAFVIALTVGVGLGLLAARYAGTVADAVITTAALVFFAMPLFWLGIMAIVVFSVKLAWLPAYGMTTVGADLRGAAAVADVVHHLIMPAAALGLFYVATYARLTRSAAIEVADSDFVRTARAKGVSDGQLWRRHILRNTLLPVITFAGMQAGHIVGGAVVTETVFAWPGVGRLALDALLQRDYNLLFAVFFVCSVMVMVFNLVADALYTAADPRIAIH